MSLKQYIAGESALLVGVCLTTRRCSSSTAAAHESKLAKRAGDRNCAGAPAADAEDALPRGGGGAGFEGRSTSSVVRPPKRAPRSQLGESVRLAVRTPSTRRCRACSEPVPSLPPDAQRHGACASASSSRAATRARCITSASWSATARCGEPVFGFRNHRSVVIRLLSALKDADTARKSM